MSFELQIDQELRLTPISLKYAEDIFSSFDKDIIQFLPIDEPPQKIEETEAFINHATDQMEKGNDLVWVILYDNSFAGCCGIHTIKSKQPHFGLWIKKEQQGRGIAKKVVAFALNWGLQNLDVDYIKYPVDRRNARSIRLIHHLKLQPSDHYVMGNRKKLEVDEYRIVKNEKDITRE